MAGIREREKQHFPLQSIQDVVDFFKDQLTDSDKPNLALSSIVLGAVENILTVNRAVSIDVDSSQILEPIFPVIELSTVEALHSKFVALVKSSVDLTEYPGGYATRLLVKKVSDVIWSSLSRSFYKDKAHLQSLYSFMTGEKSFIIDAQLTVCASACRARAMRIVSRLREHGVITITLQ
jgi:menin